MMWRLNFLVTVTCVVLQNHYMLYYICPMHTLFTIAVYAALALGQKYNAHSAGILIKCGCCVPPPALCLRNRRLTACILIARAAPALYPCAQASPGNERAPCMSE